MGKLADSLTYKLGPLPAWVWGLGLGVSVLGVQAIIRARQAKPATEPGTDGTAPEAEPSIDPFAGAQSLTYSPMGGGTWATAPSSATTPADDSLDPTEPATNDDWRKRATDYLIASGFQPTLAADALTKYLDGSALNAQEKAAVSFALRALKSPPGGAPPIQDVPIPPVPPPPTVRPRKPGPPTNLLAYHISRVEGRVAWGPPTDTGTAPIKDYLVRVSLDGGTNWKEFPRANSPAVLTHVAGTVNPNGVAETRVQIIARTEHGDSAPASIKFRTVAPAVAPAS